MRHVILCFLLIACSDSPTTTDGGKDATTQPDTSTDTGTGKDVNPPTDSGTDAPVSVPCTTPTGYTLEPFLSSTPVRSFTKADWVLASGDAGVSDAGDGGDAGVVVGKDYLALLETDVGCITINLLESDTPTTVNSFVFLALNHFFDGIAFHRVIENFMGQSGDPNTVSGPINSWGTGGPGYNFGLEVKSSLNYDAPGVVGMARSTSPDSNGSQFFITFKAVSSLNQQYTIFGKVIDGSTVLPKLVRGGTTPECTSQAFHCWANASEPTRIVHASIASK